MSEATKPWVVCLTCQSGFPLGLVVDKDGSRERWESPVLDGGEAQILEWLEQHSNGPMHDIRWLPQSEALKALLPIVELTPKDFCADDVRPAVLVDAAAPATLHIQAVLVPAADVLRSEPEVARDRSIINTNNLLAAWRSK